MVKKLLIISFVTCIALCLYSCFEDKGKDPITVKVICSGLQYTGWVMADSDTPIGLVAALLPSTSNVYYDDIEFENIDSVQVNAVVNSSTTDSATISIFIYRDSSKVKESSLSVSPSSSSRTLALTYTYGEEATSSTTK